MGKKTHKITAFHCASYQCSKNIPYYKSCFIKECNSFVLKDGERIEFKYIDRADGCSNNRHQFYRLFNSISKKSICHPGYSLVVFNAKDAYNAALDYCMNGGELYTHKMQ